MKTSITRTGKADKPWCLNWQSQQMSAPSFWYYATEEQAQQAEKQLHRTLTLAEWMQKQPPHVCNEVEQIGAAVVVPDVALLVDRGELYRLTDYLLTRVENGSLWLSKKGSIPR
jgi:hypothetical protein